MLVNIHHDNAREHNRLLVAGIASIVAIALLIYLSIAIYNKQFERVTMVTVQADRAGLQLAKFGDVRVHGALVGQVREVTDDGTQAIIKIALEPDAAEAIPDNASVEILPTTLFGQKFVSFVLPDDPSGDHITDGAVIPSSRVTTNVELSTVLADLFPLLRAVEPEDLNATLNALATALEGRGERIGETMDELGQYLDAIDDHLPTLRQDLVELAHVADAYDVAAPDLLDTLDNVTVTSKTIVEKRRELDVFFSDLGGLSDTTTRILRDNERNLVRAGQVSEPVLALLAEYSPEFTCLLKGAADYEPILSKTFRNNWVNQHIELLQPQWRVFDERDKPRYGEVGHGPWCAGLPKLVVPYKPTPLDQGSDLDENAPRSPIPNFGVFEPDWLNLTSGYAGTDHDKAIVNTMLASETGERPGDYGSLGSLLYGPVVREGRADS